MLNPIVEAEAIALVLKYQSLLVEAGLAPATINTRIGAVN